MSSVRVRRQDVGHPALLYQRSGIRRSRSAGSADARLGCDRRVISADEAVRIEPALRHIRPQLAGATYTAHDESGDANRFTRELAAHCARSGVEFLMGHTVTALREVAGQIEHAEVTDAEGQFERLRANAYVIALGSFSPLVLKPCGHIVIQRSRGALAENSRVVNSPRRRGPPTRGQATGARLGESSA